MVDKAFKEVDKAFKEVNKAIKNSSRIWEGLAVRKGRDREEKMKKEKGEKSFELLSSHGFCCEELIRETERENRGFLESVFN
jgi:hypothetical protein